MTEEECILPLHTLIGLVKDVKNYEYCPQLTCLKLVPQTEIEGFPTSAFEFKAPYEWIYTKYLEQDFELIREYCNKTNNAFFGLIYGFYCAFNPLGLDATKLNGQIYPITMHIDEAMTVPKINAPFDIIEQPPRLFGRFRAFQG